MTANDVRVELYRFFVETSRAPELAELAEGVGLSVEETLGALHQLAADDVIAFLPDTEDVWLAHPFCATKAPFQVHAQDRCWEAICIWDALGILALVESDGRVSTSCPDCNDELTVAVMSGKVEGPPQSIVHFGIPARRWYEDIAYT